MEAAAKLASSPFDSPTFAQTSPLTRQRYIFKPTMPFSNIKPDKPFHVIINCVTRTFQFQSYQSLDANPFLNVYPQLCNYWSNCTIVDFLSFKFKPLYCSSTEQEMLLTDQGTEKVDSFQDEFLMSYSGDAQFLQFLMSDVEQLLSSHLLPLKVLHILLETVI